MIINKDIWKQVYDTQGVFVQNISKIDAQKITDDILNPVKSNNQAQLLSKYTDIYNKKVLEVGSGLGVNLIKWMLDYNIDGYGLEPDSDGFVSSFKISRKLLELNNIDSNRIVNAQGESIPFKDDIFDIVYSTNVLEHVVSPGEVLDECLRVVKPNGIVQIVFPNYHSFYDGHYSVFHPPIFSNKFFQWYVKFFFQRDPKFASTIRTELNVSWCKKMIKKLSLKYRFEVLSFGEDVFLNRMKELNFETWGGTGKIKKVLSILKLVGINTILAHLFVLFRVYTPIILTLKKNENINN